MMKNKNILQTEEEFLKLNKEIDQKTKDLLNQVDQIKNMQLSNEKLCTDWSATESPTKIDTAGLECKTPQNNLTRSATPNKSSEDDFVLKEYLSTRKEDREDQKNNPEKTPEWQKKKIKHGSKSAKITPSVVGLQEQTTLALGITRHKSDVRICERKSENDVIPETLKGVGHDGITRFLSAKVKLLTQQLDIVQKDEKKHLERIKELQTYKDKSMEEREKLVQQVNVTRSNLIKYEQYANNIAAQLQTANAENSHLKKEFETLKKEMRQNNKNSNTSEIKLNRALEETEKLKAALHQIKHEEKEYKEVQRKKIEDLTTTVKKLDRQRSELLNGFKKQLLIIDNLKRQKDLIEAGKLLESAEEDFVNYLDCNPTNTMRTSDAIKSGKS